MYTYNVLCINMFCFYVCGKNSLELYCNEFVYLYSNLLYFVKF